EQIDLKKIRTIPIRTRKNKVKLGSFARVFNPRKDSFSSFLRSFPHILAAEELRKLADDVVDARRRGKPVIVMIGAHVVKVGCSPLLVDLVQRGIITCVSMNSAAAIHDVEVALWGTTSEDVETNLRDGTFGMARETGDFINGALRRGLSGGGG